MTQITLQQFNEGARVAAEFRQRPLINHSSKKSSDRATDVPSAGKKKTAGIEN